MSWVMLTIAAVVVLTLSLPPLRRTMLIKPVYRRLKKALPPMSDTEREALEAGNTWWDAELFKGKPDWRVLSDLPKPQLSTEEQAFLDGPVNELCAMLDDWDITHQRRDLPPEVWDFIKRQRFFAMIIPKTYGGLEFSEYAHSQVVMKLASRSTTAAVTVMVPNSLGPAKLLLDHGNQQQRDYYLPRLATGEDVPAFALTGPNAGSDASAMPDNGVVCRNENGELGIRLNWEKRYITLGPVATVLGLAFKLFDPEHLLGETEDMGITLALIPTQTPGVSIGRRHFPLDSGFQNGPNWGKDVFIPLDWVIGGQDGVGRGWTMLMQSLATGRALSLPALSVGGAKYACRNVGAYARVREQFNLPIAAFEGIEAVLARMAGLTYLMDAGRQVTLAALDNGQRPAVISALLKYQLTEGMRKILNDGMDVIGGSGICLGPSNFLGRLYQIIPVGITVEGANILTRTLMVFGQGSVRCHPFIQKEWQALADPDETQGLLAFDRVLTGHALSFAGHVGRGLCYRLGGWRLAQTPGDRDTHRDYQRLQQLTTVFATVADLALMTFGGGLKRKERLSGALADVLSHLYLASCALKHYETQGGLPEDRPLLDWAMHYAFSQAQDGLASALKQIPAGCVFRLLLPSLPTEPDQALCKPLTQILTTDHPARERLTAGIYVNHKPDDPTGRIEIAFTAVLATEPVWQKLKQLKKTGQLTPTLTRDALIDQALAKKLLTNEEAECLRNTEAARRAAIKVDDFAPADLVVGA
ncbi:MAG: acyl-CoA dehydrogenase [Methylococcales bacterium]|nr:acyl-CoA dehydrogenase [Methylococcales bacterium]